MPSCSNDLGKELWLYFFLVVLSAITFFFGLIPLYNYLEKTFEFTIPVWVETPSIFGLFGVFFALFDRYFWKYRVIKVFGLPKIPNLNGKWKATISRRDENDNEVKKKESDVIINQNYSKFNLLMKDEGATSDVKMATFQISNPINRRIIYTYVCEPHATAPDEFQMHEGTTTLEIMEGDKEMSGNYYSGKGRRHHGTVYLKKIN